MTPPLLTFRGERHFCTVYASRWNSVFPTVKDTNGNYFSGDGNGNAIDTLGAHASHLRCHGTAAGQPILHYNILNPKLTSQIRSQRRDHCSTTSASPVDEYSGRLPLSKAFIFRIPPLTCSLTISGNHPAITGERLGFHSAHTRAGLPSVHEFHRCLWRSQ